MEGDGVAEALSAERIVDVALERIDAEGVASLTMRSLAGALGSTPMSLYRHVRDKAELEAMLVDRVLEGVATVRLEGDWRERAAGLHAALRRAVLARPGLGRLAVERWSRSRGRTRIQDRLFGILQEAGFRGPDVVIAADALELFALGSISHDLSTLDAAGSTASGRLAHIDIESTPNLVDFSVYLIRRDADVMFASGHAALLEGLEAALVREA